MQRGNYIAMLMCYAGFVTNSTGVAPKLSLLSIEGKELCDAATPYQTTSTPAANNFTEATFLFQNNRDCIDQLDQVAGLMFSPPDGTKGVWSFCVDKLGLLPSKVDDTLAQIGQSTAPHRSFLPFVTHMTSPP